MYRLEKLVLNYIKKHGDPSEHDEAASLLAELRQLERPVQIPQAVQVSEPPPLPRQSPEPPPQPPQPVVPEPGPEAPGALVEEQPQDSTPE